MADGCKQVFPPQSLLAPEPVSDLHHVCRAYRPLSCCTAQASYDMVRTELENLQLPLGCWPLMKARLDHARPALRGIGTSSAWISRHEP